MKIFALVLTYNSGKFIKNVLDTIPKNTFDKIICSDDGSSDQTINIIQNENITLVRNNHGGYGSNLFSGLQKCFDEGASHVVEVFGDVRIESEGTLGGACRFFASTIRNARSAIAKASGT